MEERGKNVEMRESKNRKRGKEERKQGGESDRPDRKWGWRTSGETHSTEKNEVFFLA